MVRALTTLLVLLIPIGAAAGVDLYQSNELGMEITPISPAAAAGLQWVLAVDRSGAVEVRTLTDHGTEATRWVRTYSGGVLVSERVFEKGSLSSLTDYRGGLPVRRVDYSGGKETEVRDYAYSGGRLQSASVYSPAGKLEYRDLYAEGPDGRLRRAVREGPGGERSVIALSFAGDRLLSEWLGTDHNGVLTRFSGGELVSREQWKGTDLVSKEEVSTGKGGATTVTRDFQSGLVSQASYNPEGLLLRERVTENGSVVRSVDCTYSGSRLESKVTITPGRREAVRYHYDANGALLTADTTVNRELVKVTHYTGKDTYVEDLYLNGRVVLHVFYENGKPVKEVAASSGGTTGGEGGGGG